MVILPIHLYDARALLFHNLTKVLPKKIEVDAGRNVAAPFCDKDQMYVKKKNAASAASIC